MTLLVGADAFGGAEGTTTARRERPSLRWPHRGRRAGRVSKGRPGTWETSPPPRRSGTRMPRTTKAAGMGVEESEHLVVPRKPGNRPDGTRWREGDAECLAR